MAELPIAPGQVYVEVDYDYEYKNKDRLITIRQGECYMLVKKTNEDWWQVKREEGTKAFYVPAQYVREVRKALMPPPKALGHVPASTGNNTSPQSGSALWVKPTTLDLGPHDRPTENSHRHDSSYRRSPSAQTATSGHFSPPSHRRDSNHHHGPASPTEHDRALADILVQGGVAVLPHKEGSGTLPRTRARSPERVRGPLDLDSTQHCDSAGEERRTNDSESGDELSSSSTEHLQTVSSSGRGRSDSPVYTNLQELKITQNNQPPLPSGSPLHVFGDWETFKDQNGRHYYYNRSTQERTWKPPRTRETSTGSSRGDSHSTGESTEWLKHIDEQGRPYYYSADGSRSEWELPKPSDKSGLVNVTKITENGKKVRKNWTSSLTILQGSCLLFTKGHGGGTSWFGGSQSKPEFTVDLRGGSVEWASKDKSSKKHVIELKTRQGTELLIQSENESVASEWFRALQETISTHAWESDEAIEEDMPESPGVEKHDREKDHRDSKKGRAAMKPSASLDASDNKKTRHKLKKFLTRRPTLQAVRDKGYIKDQVFGGSLSDLCHRENSTVPSFVKMCIEHVESDALYVDGLYRVSGNLAVIQKLRFAVNHDEKVNLADGKWEDIHVTTGALKMYFRELPEPLFTYALFHDFVSAIKISDYKQRVHSIKELVRQLPKPNHDTMQALFKHLRKVIEYGEENRMTTQSIAIVFGPTLLRPETETWNMAVHMVYQNQIVELILLEYENIFGR
ncbi:rho GTPase-activating protein 12-like isoform X13 [Gouania willdenowi]|uniref:rho GTPase-activating protein 12-like isoform X13 n=1 Tax=Gouania willdenowi TaxID=441366 RepID=UPI00105664DA|nr:rho GTPase-activating protein 12-like isoform X13 [Gouania willdenowi]